MSDKSDRTAKLVYFGAGGDTVEYGSGCSGSGYGTPDSPHAADGCIIPDGTYAIDKRAAVETTEGYKWVFRGPMVNVDLAPNAVDRCPEPSAMLRAVVADNAYGGLLALKDAHKSADAGPLDSVDTLTYVNGWREHGARIGQYVDGQIVWED